MGWVMDLIGACVRVAWWDGSCLGLRPHRLGDLIDRVAAEPRGGEPGAGRLGDSRGADWPASSRQRVGIVPAAPVRERFVTHL